MKGIKPGKLFEWPHLKAEGMEILSSPALILWLNRICCWTLVFQLQYFKLPKDKLVVFQFWYHKTGMDVSRGSEICGGSQPPATVPSEAEEASTAP